MHPVGGSGVASRKGRGPGTKRNQGGVSYGGRFSEIFIKFLGESESNYFFMIANQTKWSSKIQRKRESARRSFIMGLRIQIKSESERGQLLWATVILLCKKYLVQGYGIWWKLPWELLEGSWNLLFTSVEVKSNSLGSTKPSMAWKSNHLGDRVSLLNLSFRPFAWG